MKEMVCIVCPNSCLLEIKEKDGDITVTGAKCKKGIEFARTELTDPRRALSSTIRTSFERLPVVAVRTSGEIRKADIPKVMAAISTCKADRPYSVGEVIIKNVAESGEDIICTVEMKRYI